MCRCPVSDVVSVWFLRACVWCRFRPRRARGVQHVEVLGLVAARDAADPGGRDVRAGDRVLPAGLLLVIGEVAQVAALRGLLCLLAEQDFSPSDVAAMLGTRTADATRLLDELAGVTSMDQSAADEPSLPLGSVLTIVRCLLADVAGDCRHRSFAAALTAR